MIKCGRLGFRNRSSRNRKWPLYKLDPLWPSGCVSCVVMALKSYTPVGAELHKAEKQPVQSPMVFKMVVIGETGSGKTSFIRLLLNYSKQYANAGQTFDLKKIESFIEDERPQLVEKKVWDSDTTTSTKYAATFGSFQLEVIDTPGLVDTRGEKQEQENIANIIQILRQEIFINCVCLIINGTQSRLIDAVKKVLSEIVSILPSDVLNNIIVVFTKVRDELSLEFDYCLLKIFDLQIPNDYCFTFDNPYSRLCKASKSSPKTYEKLHKCLPKDFKETHEILERMFALLKTFKPAVTIKFGEFHEISQNIRDSLANLQVQYINIREIREKFANVGCEGSDDMFVTYIKTILKYSDKKTVFCIACLQNCHSDCECFFAILFVRACSVFKGGQCTMCNHSNWDHYRSNRSIVKVKINVPLTALDQKTKDEFLKKELAPCYQAIDKETEELKEKIKKFQCLSSIFFFSNIAMEAIEGFKKDIEKIPCYKYKQDIIVILDSTLVVLHNPQTAEDNEAKYLWACGALGVDPKNVTESNIEKLFRQQSKKVHPDATKDESTSKMFKYLIYAKDFLIKNLSGRR